MGLFGGPNVDKLAAKRDLKGLAKALTNGDPEVRDSAERALAGIDGEDAVHAIAERLDGQQDEAVIDSGVGALRAMGDPVAPALLTGLRESPDDTKPLYGALLGRLGAQQGLAPLLEATHDSDPTVRGTAAFGLALIDDPEAPKRIIAVFQTDEDMDARGLAAMALGAKKLPGAYETFSEALDGDDALGRALGATGLGMLEDARAVPRLQQLADLDDDERVRNSAHSALADLQKSARVAGAIDLTLRAAPGTVELGRRRAHTRLLNGGCPDQVRVRRGGRVRIYPEPDPLPVGVGEYVRFVIGEATGMLHPMHLYGHFFRTGGRAARSRRRSFRRRCGSRRSTGSATAPAGWACH